MAYRVIRLLSIATLLLVISCASEEPPTPQQDVEAVVRLALATALVAQEIPDYGLLNVNGGEVVLSTESTKGVVLPELAGVSLVALGPGEIQARADTQGDFLYLRFREIHFFGNDRARVQLENSWAVGQQSTVGYLSGGGFTLAFERRDGDWEVTITGMWIA